ncbi:YqzL family protein [Iocasia frigidifontis]|uniref:YqzL family protein n=1 Tax=Iocasia fonsfrigidae TaxID=2682810 RepID=A0A8A7KAV4_9FIRM|nr:MULTISPECIES: YqzL family protein [Halanaerobiaceae]AZO95720.1 YqzL family protein [Halocella sp. SP3-1]MTI60917.1 YqzL family protein [Bacillota bacterium]QTL98581.1 YqzL family protein [Iocasia fonsfrigidae]
MGLTATFFWRLFEETGSINAYLVYKQMYLMMRYTPNKQEFI